MIILISMIITGEVQLFCAVKSSKLTLSRADYQSETEVKSFLQAEEVVPTK